MASTKNVAIVAGATGIIGRNLVIHLSKNEDWEVYAISRRNLDFKSTAKHLCIDLLDRDATFKAVEGLHEVTHIFFAAYLEVSSLSEQIPPNLSMLRNLVEGIEKASAKLRHVCLAEGTKWYGVHMGPAKTPSKEDDARCMPPMFYFDQEDYLSNRSKETKKWTWSGVRPNPVCGFALGNPMNLITGIATYGSMCKELGLPFRFPGTAKGFETLLEICDVEILCKMMVWSSTEPKCANTAFNVSNGDIFRWRNVWPALAKFFQLELDNGPILHLSLTQMMADKGQLWDSVVEKNGLQKISYKDITSWTFLDWVFSRDYDWFCDVNKARRLGFHEMTQDSEEMLIRMLQALRDQKIIP